MVLENARDDRSGKAGMNSERKHSFGKRSFGVSGKDAGEYAIRSGNSGKCIPKTY